MSEGALVRDLMTRDPFSVDRNESVLEADKIMNLGRVRHVLVVDKAKRLEGVISQRDLFLSGLVRALGYGSHAKQRALDTLVAKEVMTSDLVTVTPETSLKDAALLMLKHKIGCLPVVSDDRLVGILTESDFVKLHAS